MGSNSKIEWCDHTFNPVMGCVKVSDGCKFCYAEEMMDKQYGKAQWGEWAPCTHFAITEGTESNRVHRFEDGQLMYRYGKKVAGRELDGREWDEMPV